MMTSTRYVLLVLVIIISLHYILSFSNEMYGQATSFGSIKKVVAGGNKSPYKTATPGDYHGKPNITVAGGRRANAAIVILARNRDIDGVVSSVKQMEDRFNRKFGYDYVLLNERPFDNRFKNRLEQLTDSKIKYGLISREDWVQPAWIDEKKASAARQDMVQNNIIYGGSVPYRNMCRFNSGFFYRQEILKPYKFYWRVEPGVKFFCDIDYDPFLFMEDEKKVYGFTIALYDYRDTIPTLWATVRDFIEQNPGLIAPGNSMQFLSDNNGTDYNLCHFWSNFEIGDLDFWRGEAYSKFFDHLDKAGGFYYERWGDAPIHSIGVALFAKKEQIHFFNDIGYRHEPFQHCPQGNAHKQGKCWCDERVNFDHEEFSCLKRYNNMFS